MSVNILSINNLYELEKTHMLYDIKFNVSVDDSDYSTFIPTKPLYITSSLHAYILSIISICKGKYFFKLMVSEFGYFDLEEIEYELFVSSSKELLERKIELLLLLG
jgi:hypothetical protein